MPTAILAKPSTGSPGVPRLNDMFEMILMASARILADFGQKFNRLIGGSASVGLEVFTPLSRKTSLLAERCSEIKEMTIITLIANLNTVVKVLSECFNDPDKLREIESRIPAIEAKIDICMAAVDLAEPEIADQDEVDEIIAEYEL